MPFLFDTAPQDQLILPEDLKEDLENLEGLLNTVARSSAGTEDDALLRNSHVRLTAFRGELDNVLHGDCSKEKLARLVSCSKGLLTLESERAIDASGVPFPNGRILAMESLLGGLNGILPIQYAELQKLVKDSIKLWDVVEPQMVPMLPEEERFEDSIPLDLDDSDRSSQNSGAAGASLPVVIPAASSLCGFSYVLDSAAQSGLSSFREWKEPSHSTFLDEISAYLGFLDRVSLRHLVRHTASRNRTNTSCESVSQDNVTV
jgi:hypothetical protein